MKSVSGKTLAKTLERHGWRLLRINGSHHIFGKEGSKTRISIPLHGNKPLKIGLLHHFLKETGLSEADI